MKEEDKVFLKVMSQTFEALTKRLERTGDVPPPPILFTAKCLDCGADTVHVSFIARRQDGIPIASSTMITVDSFLPKAIKRCLSCGLITYEKED